MKSFVHKQCQRIKNALRGLFLSFKNDLHIRLHILLGIFFIFFGYIFRPLTDTETLFLILSFILIFITELQNTSFEKALDKLHPNQSPDIGESKDIAAASVFISSLFALFILIWITTNHL